MKKFSERLIFLPDPLHGKRKPCSACYFKEGQECQVCLVRVHVRAVDCGAKTWLANPQKAHQSACRNFACKSYKRGHTFMPVSSMMNGLFCAWAMAALSRTKLGLTQSNSYASIAQLSGSAHLTFQYCIFYAWCRKQCPIISAHVLSLSSG